MKNLMGIFIAVCMILSLAVLPAAAHQDFSDGTDFESFTSGYNKNDSSTYNEWGVHILDTAKGYMTQREAQDEGNGVYAEGPEGSKYGKALKIYQGHVEDSNKYGAVAYFLKENLYNTVYFEGSFYAENAIARILRFYGSNGSSALPSVHFTRNKTIEVFGNGTSAKYELNKWYDVKIWFNMEDDTFRVLITCDGDTVLDQSGNNKYTSLSLSYISKIEFFNSITCKALTEDSYCYWDNVKIESVYSYSAKRGTLDNFEEYLSSEPTAVPKAPGNARYTYSLSYEQAGTDGVVSDNTAGKGTSAKIVSENKTYPTLITDLKATIPSADVQFSIKIPDYHGTRLIYLTLEDGKQLTALYFTSKGKISDIKNEPCSYELNKWYDVRITYDSAAKTEKYWVWDESGNLIAHDTILQEDATVSNVKRVMFRMTNNSSDMQKCFFWLDDLSIAEVVSESTEIFAVNYEESTTGAGKKVVKSDDVVIKFNNKLAETETPETLLSKFTLNFGKGKIESVEKTDDYTLKLNFEKESGKHYHAAFSGITDVYGNTLSDYIEFDTLLPDKAIGSVSFLRDGAPISLLSPGEVTARFTAEAHNGNTLNVMHMLALYCDSRLSDVVTETISAYEGETVSSLTLNVPDDGKTYVVKSLRWDSVTLAPFGAAAILKPTTDLPIVIIKLDDFGYSSRLPVFESVKDWVVENELKASFGLMGYTLGANNASRAERVKIKAIYDTPNIEIWSHGYDYRSGKFHNGTVVKGDILQNAGNDTEVTTTTESQRMEFSEVLRTSKAEGINIKSFNPPSNDMDETTVKLLDEEFKEIKTVMVIANSLPSYLEGEHNFTPLYKHIKMEEGGTGCTRQVDDLKADWEKAKSSDSEYVLLQLHPYDWSSFEGSEERFKEFILWLKAEGAVFMTPSEYTAYAEQIK